VLVRGTLDQSIALFPLPLTGKVFVSRRGGEPSFFFPFPPFILWALLSFLLSTKKWLPQQFLPIFLSSTSVPVQLPLSSSLFLLYFLSLSFAGHLTGLVPGMKFLIAGARKIVTPLISSRRFFPSLKWSDPPS